MRPMIESMFVGANNRSAGDAVNNILPALATTTDGSRPTPRSSDVPSGESVTSNLEIVTSVTSLRSTLSRARATAVMFTDSPGCPPCRAIKPHFENLAQLRPRTTFALVETRLGQGREIASMQEFGGPVTATPTFVFFVGTQIVGECKGADKTELDTRIGMLELEAFPRQFFSFLFLFFFSVLLLSGREETWRKLISEHSLHISSPFSSPTREARIASPVETVEISRANHVYDVPSSPGALFEALARD